MQAPGVLDDLGITARGVGRVGEARERLDGQAPQPLALGDDPVVVTARQQIPSEAADRSRRIALGECVKERDDVDPHRRSGAPPDPIPSGVDDVRRSGQRAAQVVDQLAQVGPCLGGSRVRPQLAGQPVPGHPRSSGKGQPRHQPGHPLSRENGIDLPVHRGPDLPEQPDHDVHALGTAWGLDDRRGDHPRPSLVGARC